MSQNIFMKRVLKGLTGLVILLNAVILVLSLSLINRNAKALEEVHHEIVDLKAKVEEEIKLREELFTTLRKSASVLQEYNPQLDDLTAYKYACKIYECSEPPVTPELLTALIVVESSANHVAVSNKGAIGLTQVMPTIWDFEEQELFNPYKNIEIGSKILKQYVDRYGVKGGLSSYNSGRKNRALRYAHYVLTVAENL